MGSQERVDYLVQRARDNGGLDNITVEIVEFSITPGSPSKPQRRKNRNDHINCHFADMYWRQWRLLFLE